MVPYLPYLALILVMSVVPGEGGQGFIPEVEHKIHEIRDLLNSYHVNALINVDGGVNFETKEKCREADILTSGSYIVLSDNYQEKISSLR